MACVDGTVETLELRSPSTTAMSLLFPSQGHSIVAPSSFPNLRSLSLHEVSCDHAQHYLSVVQFLYVQLHLRVFRLVWPTDPFLDSSKLYAGRGTFHTLNTIGGHLSRIARGGMNIYLGTRDKNYVVMNRCGFVLSHSWRFSHVFFFFFSGML
jgi:hypothetical protein